MRVSGSVAANVLGLDVAHYQPHALHGHDANWSEINCSADLWIELLHSLGLEPLAAGAFAIAADFVGDQWSFLKFPPEDVRELFGIAVDEINVWRPVAEHAVEQLSRGRLLTVEVDAFWLPDVGGTDYRRTHTKTTIGLAGIDPAGRAAAYFHGPGYFTLSGSDYDGVFNWQPGGSRLAPYVEVIDLASMVVTDVRAVARQQLARQLARVPLTNPVERLGLRLLEDLPWISAMGVEGYHGYAFGVVRQCGAGAELAAAYLRWLGDVPIAGFTAFARISELAKSLQFSVARAARGRVVEVSGIIEEMAAAWETGIAELRRCTA